MNLINQLFAFISGILAAIIFIQIRWKYYEFYKYVLPKDLWVQGQPDEGFESFFATDGYSTEYIYQITYNSKGEAILRTGKKIIAWIPMPQYKNPDPRNKLTLLYDKTSKENNDN